MQRIFFAIVLLSESLNAQRPRRAPQQETRSAGAFQQPAVTFTGKLKELTSKAIILDTGEAQPITIYRNRKTRFLQGTLAINAKKISEGTRLSLDVATNPDGSLQAVNVMILP